MRTTMLIAFICSIMQTIVFGELTEQDLEAIQKVVKEEISKSEQRTSDKFAAINTELGNIKTETRVIQTDIKGVKDRLDDTHGLVIAIIASIGIVVIIASAMTYTAAKLGSASAELGKAHATFNETNRLLEEYTKQREQFNEHLANIEALRTLIEEFMDEPSNNPTAQAPAD